MKHFFNVVLPAVSSLLLSISGLQAQPVMNLPPDCPNLVGQISCFNNEATPLYDVQVVLKTTDGQVLQTATTDYLGQYGFCQLMPGNYVLTAASSRPVGGINSTDAMIALQHYAGHIILTGLKFMAADINNNGYVNSTDALMILRRSVGQITTFPAGDWVFESKDVNITGSDPITLNFSGLCYADLDASYIPGGCTPMPDPSNAGPDQTVTGTSTTLAANMPVNGTGSWSIISGSDGNIADASDPASGFSGGAGNSYTLVWTISTICSGTADTVIINFNAPSFTCGSPFTDTRDGQVYNTVQIGSQCWMQENLNIGTMVISTYTPSHSNCSDNGIIEKYCYDNDTANCEIYGGLYDWNEMMGYVTTAGVQGICPADWHIPTDVEWCALTTFIDPTIDCNAFGWTGTTIADKMKETGSLHWWPPNASANNQSGFTALGAGIRDSSVGSFKEITKTAYFWTSSDFSGGPNARGRVLSYHQSRISFSGGGKEFGFSVRCIRNN